MPTPARTHRDFLAIPDSQEHAFAKTLEEHNQNRRKYGYN